MTQELQKAMEEIQPFLDRLKELSSQALELKEHSSQAIQDNNE